VTLRDLPLVAPGRYVADDIENRAARPSPCAITWSKTRPRSSTPSRETHRYNKRGFPAQLRSSLGGETARFSLRIPIRLPFALARASTVHSLFVSLAVSLSPPLRRCVASFSRSWQRRTRVYACLYDIYIYIYIYIHITTHNSVLSSPSVSVLPTYCRRLVNAV